MISEELSPAAQSQALARYARAQFNEAQAINEKALGRKPKHETFVDGSKTEAVERVRPDGTVVYEFELLDDLFGYIDLQLIVHSPTKSGRYRRSHVLLADGSAVDPDQPMPNASRFVYLNTTPYSRKMEGIPGRPPQSKQAPDGVYLVVAGLANKRFGNIASIKFGYETPLFGAINSWADNTTMVRADRPNMKGGTRAEWLRRQPAIIVTMR